MWEGMVVERCGRVRAEGDGCMCVFTSVCACGGVCVCACVSASVWCESALLSSGCRLQISINTAPLTDLDSMHYCPLLRHFILILIILHREHHTGRIMILTV